MDKLFSTNSSKGILSEMKIDIQEPVHTTTCRVLYGDTDAAGVVYYGNYMRYFEIGRTEFMRDLVRSYKEIEDEGLVLPVIECSARYKASATYDDLLIIKTSLVGWLFNRTVKVAVPPASFVKRPSIGNTVTPGLSSSLLTTVISVKSIPL